MSIHKILSYTRGTLHSVIPSAFYRFGYRHVYLQKIRDADEALWERVNYYNKLTCEFDISGDDVFTGLSYRKQKSWAYHFDFVKILKHFNRDVKFLTLFGDVIHVPGQPTIVKSRPITQANENSVLMKLNSVRHFNFVSDHKSWSDKRDKAVWRGSGFQPNRLHLLDAHRWNTSCDIGMTKPRTGNASYLVQPMTVKDQLDYKFVLCPEGNDVATNLKWVMSSKSLAVMPVPKFETWFMEGKLVAGQHFIDVSDDYSNLDERMEYYLTRPKEAMEVSREANEHVSQFIDSKREYLISLMVFRKYLAGCNELLDGSSDSSRTPFLKS